MENIDKIKCILIDFENNDKTLNEAANEILLLFSVMVELACPRCGSTNTAPSDKENDAGCYECGFVWQDN